MLVTMAVDGAVAFVAAVVAATEIAILIASGTVVQASNTPPAGTWKDISGVVVPIVTSPVARLKNWI